MQTPYTVERRILYQSIWMTRYYWSLRYDDTEILASKDATEIKNKAELYNRIYNEGYRAAIQSC